MTVNDNQPLKRVKSKSSKQCDQGYSEYCIKKGYSEYDPSS